MKYSLTGHRPKTLGGYGEQFHRAQVTAAKLAFTALSVETVISGMALGFDQAGADAALEEGIPYVAAVPFKGQESIWPRSSVKFYQSLIARANDVVVVSDGPYEAWKLHKRNEWMVDVADGVIALWNGEVVKNSGTLACIRYALKKEKPIYNAWEIYQYILHNGYDPEDQNIPKLIKLQKKDLESPNG